MRFEPEPKPGGGALSFGLFLTLFFHIVGQRQNTCTRLLNIRHAFCRAVAAYLRAMLNIRHAYFRVVAAIGGRAILKK